MNTRLVNTAAQVIFAAQKNGHTTATGWALALESAQLLQSPETAAETERLRLRVDEVERAYTFDTAELRRENDELRARVAELETAAKQGRTEAIADVGDWLDENGQKDAAYLVYTVDIPAAREMRVVQLEDPHDSPLHHEYRLGRDLPATGGA
ncbi:hypothetical protein SGLAM104S_01573 [Streptomyces glaucescens]